MSPKRPSRRALTTKPSTTTTTTVSKGRSPATRSAAARLGRTRSAAKQEARDLDPQPSTSRTVTEKTPKTTKTTTAVVRKSQRRQNLQEPPIVKRTTDICDPVETDDDDDDDECLSGSVSENDHDIDDVDEDLEDDRDHPQQSTSKTTALTKTPVRRSQKTTVKTAIDIYEEADDESLSGSLSGSDDEDMDVEEEEENPGDHRQSSTSETTSPKITRKSQRGRVHKPSVTSLIYDEADYESLSGSESGSDEDDDNGSGHEIQDLDTLQPSGEKTRPVNESPQPSVEPSQPSVEPSQPPVEPSQPPVEPSQPSDEPHQPSTESASRAKKTTPVKRSLRGRIQKPSVKVPIVYKGSSDSESGGGDEQEALTDFSSDSDQDPTYEITKDLQAGQKCGRRGRSRGHGDSSSVDSLDLEDLRELRSQGLTNDENEGTGPQPLSRRFARQLASGRIDKVISQIVDDMDDEDDLGAEEEEEDEQRNERVPRFFDAANEDSADGDQQESLSRPGKGFTDMEFTLLSRGFRPGIPKVRGQVRSRGRPPGRSMFRSQARLPLSAVLRGIMGEANICIARDDLDEAEALCKEIIKEHYSHPDPYEALAQIYEKREDLHQAFKYKIIACYLSPGNFESWQATAEMAEEFKEYRLAHFCLSQAINLRSTANFHLHTPIELLRQAIRSRGYYQELLNLRKNALQNQRTLLKTYIDDETPVSSLSPEERSEALRIATKMASMQASNERATASNLTIALNLILRFIGPQTDLSTANEAEKDAIAMYLKLLNQSGRNEEVINFMIDRFKIPISRLSSSGSSRRKFFKSTNEVDPQISRLIVDGTLAVDERRATTLKTFENMDPNFLTRLIVALINSNCFESIDFLTAPILRLPYEFHGDLMAEVANAYYKAEDLTRAQAIYRILYDQDYRDKYDTFVRYAQCCMAETGENEDTSRLQAIRVLSSKMDVEPERTDVRRLLADCLLKAGRLRQALNIAHRDSFTRTRYVDPKTQKTAAGHEHYQVPLCDLDYLRVRLEVLRRRGRWAPLVRTIRKMLLSETFWICSPDEYLIIMLATNYQYRLQNIREHRGRERTNATAAAATAAVDNDDQDQEDNQNKATKKKTPRRYFIRQPFAYIGRPVDAKEFMDLLMEALEFLITQPTSGADLSERQEIATNLIMSSFLSRALAGRADTTLTYLGVVILTRLRVKNVPYQLAKHVAQSRPASVELYNLLSVINSKISRDLRFKRIALTRLERHPDSRPLQVMEVIFRLLSGRYEWAALSAMKFLQDIESEEADSSGRSDVEQDPLLAFMPLLMAVALLHILCAKKTTARNHVMSQIIKLMTVYQQRRCGLESPTTTTTTTSFAAASRFTQEVWYNLGRVYQSLQLWPLAIECYEQALAVGPARLADAHGLSPDEVTQGFDLTREAAHNLSIILIEIDNQDRARQVLERIVI